MNLTAFRLSFTLVVTAIACCGAEVHLSPTYLPLQQGETAKLITADAAGNLFVVSTLADSVQVVKLDAQQNIVATFRSTALATPNAATTDAAGNLLLVGTTNTETAYLARIDSQLTKVVSTNSLGNGGSRGFAVATDSAGNIYIGGSTTSQNFPITPGAFQTTPPKFGRVGQYERTRFGFVTMFAPAADRILYSTYIGGDNAVCWPGGECHPIAATEVDSVAISAVGEIIAGGKTTALDLPVTPGTIGQNCFCATGHTAGWVAKFSSEAFVRGWLTYATRPRLTDFIGEMAVDSVGATKDGGVAFGGLSVASYLPTPGAFGLGTGFGNDDFLTKVDATGKRVLFTSILGERRSLLAAVAGPPVSVAVSADDTIWVSGEGFNLYLPTTGALLGGFVYSFPKALTLQGIGIICQTTAADAGISMLPDGSVAVLGSYGSMLIVDSNRGVGPVVGVSSAARDTVTGRVAANELIGIYGYFGSGSFRAQPVNGVYGPLLGGMRITFDGVPAPLLLLADQQIQTVVPSSVKAGSTPLVRIESPVVQFQFRLNTAEAVPQVYLSGGSAKPTTSGNIPSSYLASAYDVNGKQIYELNPATTGQVVTITATGLGDDGTGLADGSIVTAKSSLGRLPISIMSLDDKQVVEVLYAGPAVGQVHGVSRIDFRMPPKACGDYCRFALQVGSAVSEPFGIPVKP